MPGMISRRHIPLSCSMLSGVLVFCCAFSHGEDDLAGKWKGTWTDKRPNTGNSGGTLWAEAELLRKDTWKVVFHIDSTRKYEVVFKGRRDEGVLVFSGYTDTGDKRALYYWTARVDANGFSGTYEGTDEKGVFMLARQMEKKRE